MTMLFREGDAKRRSGPLVEAMGKYGEVWGGWGVRQAILETPGGSEEAGGTDLKTPGLLQQIALQTSFA